MAFASYNSVYGKVESSWEKKDGKIVYKIVVPSNCTATINLPGMEEREVDTGEYVIEGF